MYGKSVSHYMSEGEQDEPAPRRLVTHADLECQLNHYIYYIGGANVGVAAILHEGFSVASARRTRWPSGPAR